MGDERTRVPEGANHGCPGTQDENAGKADACAGCPNQQICASAPKGPDPGEFLRPLEDAVGLSAGLTTDILLGVCHSPPVSSPLS